MGATQPPPPPTPPKKIHILKNEMIINLLLQSKISFHSGNNDHGYVSLAMNTSRSSSHSSLMTGFVPRLTRGVPLAEQEHCHPSGAPVCTLGISGVRVV